MAGMPDDAQLRPATPNEIADTLAFALRYDGRRQHHRADQLMAQLMAEHLVQHLARSGFVVMKRPPPVDRAPDYPIPGERGSR
jgi:hypothetical protein